jgi:hypothetical protein
MTARMFPDEPVVGLDQAEKNYEGWMALKFSKV